jgi:lactate dehydrogenase-like 2-hydroxyacid dehydrogenase
VPVVLIALVSTRWASKGVAGIYCLLTDKIDAEVLEACGDGLKVVSTMSVGYNHIDVEWCKAHGVAVGYTPDVLTETTADLAVGVLLATARRIPEAARAVQDGEWTTWKPMWLTGKDVFGSTVGIIGFGRIGAAIGRRLKGFGCSIIYTGASGPKPAVADPLAAEFRDLDALVSESDFVVVACALVDATRGLLGEAQFKAMKPDAVVVNIARGEVIDQDALIAALQAGEIGGAGLDVTTPEPVPLSNPLLAMPNVVVLPHIGSASITTRKLIAKMAADNVVAGVRGEALPFGVPGTAVATASAASAASTA